SPTSSPTCPRRSPRPSPPGSERPGERRGPPRTRRRGAGRARTARPAPRPWCAPSVVFRTRGPAGSRTLIPSLQGRCAAVAPQARPHRAGPAVLGRPGRARQGRQESNPLFSGFGGRPPNRWLTPSCFRLALLITGVVINGAFRSSGAQSVFSVRARMRTVIGVRERPGEGSRPGPTGTYKRGVRSNDARGERHETTNGRPDDTLPVLP